MVCQTCSHSVYRVNALHVKLLWLAHSVIIYQLDRATTSTNMRHRNRRNYFIDHCFMSPLFVLKAMSTDAARNDFRRPRTLKCQVSCNFELSWSTSKNCWYLEGNTWSVSLIPSFTDNDDIALRLAVALNRVNSHRTREYFRFEEHGNVTSRSET